MIIDLSLNNKTVIIIGGGKEAQKRLRPIINQNCKIIVVSEKINSQISKLAKAKKIQVLEKEVPEIKPLVKSINHLDYADASCKQSTDASGTISQHSLHLGRLTRA